MKSIASQRILVCWLAAGLIGLIPTFRSLAERAQIGSDKRTGNTVTISTENAFRYGRFLWVSAEADPPIHYTFAVTTNPGSGWELATPTPSPSVGPLDFSGKRGLQPVVTVKFQTEQTRGDGTPEDTDEVMARVFAIKFNYEFKREFESPEVRNFIPANSTLSNGKPFLNTEIVVTTDPQVSNDRLMAMISTRNSGSNTDTLNPSEPTRKVADQKFHTTLQTREKGPSLQVSMLGQRSPQHEMLPAVYRSTFHVTGYYTPSEANFSGPIVSSTTYETPNPWKRYRITASKPGREGFLQNIALEGEGYYLDGTHAVVTNHTVPDKSNPILIDSSIGTDNQPPQDCNGNRLQPDTCAIVKNAVVPNSATIQIIGRDTRRATDCVSSSQQGGNYHVDLYMGFDRNAANSIREDDTVILLDY